MEKQQFWTRNFIAACCSNLLQFMIFYVLVATLPLFITEQLKCDKEATGFVMAAFLFSVVLVRPIAGKLVDAYDKRKVLILSSALFVPVAFIYPLVSGIFLLLLLRFVHGISFGISNTASATIAVEVIPEKRKGEGVSFYSVFMSLGMAIGPFLGLTIIAHYDFTVLFGFCIVLSLLLVFAGVMLQPVKQAKKAAVTDTALISWRRFFEPDALLISLAGCCLAFAWSGVATFFSLYATESNLASSARYFFVVYSGTIVLSRPLIGRLFDRMGPSVAIYPACCSFVVGLFLLSQAHSAAAFLIAGAVIGLGNGSLFSCYQTLAVQYSPLNRRGLGTSTFFFMFDLGMVLGSSLLGVVASYTGYSTMYELSALLLLLSVGLYKAAAGRNKATQQKG